MTDTKTNIGMGVSVSAQNRRFSGDESFLRDPNAFNDTINEKAIEGEGTFVKGSGPKI